MSIAYETLSDPERRRRYDRFGPDEGAMGPGDLFGGAGFGDLFDAFFGAAGRPRGRRSGPVRGADAEVVVEIAFRDAVFGSSPDVAVELPTACADCGGSGARPGTSAMRCPDCDGTGSCGACASRSSARWSRRRPVLAVAGSARPSPAPAPPAEATAGGLRPRPTRWTCPPGSTTAPRCGSRAGAPPVPAAARPATSTCTCRWPPTRVFEREGTDLSAVLPVSFTQAALGAELPFATLDGEEKLAVPAGVQTGHVIRLRGRGVPHVRGRGRGDLHVQVVVTTPTDLSKSQEELLRRLAVERGEPVAQPAEGFVSRLKSALGGARPPACRSADRPPSAPRPRSSSTTSRPSSCPPRTAATWARRSASGLTRRWWPPTGPGSWRLCAFTGSALRAEGEVRTAPAPCRRWRSRSFRRKATGRNGGGEKLTELGCDRIVALRSARAVVRWDGERATRSLDRLRRVAAPRRRRAGGRGCLSSTASSRSKTWNAAAGALAQPGADALGPGDTAIAVGPEGGWAPEELAGRRVVGLGETILRSETAAMVAGALLSRHGGAS